MKLISLDVMVDRLPDGCNVAKAEDERCIFSRDKYCVLKQSLGHENCFVQNNRGFIPTDCPLVTKSRDL